MIHARPIVANYGSNKKVYKKNHGAWKLAQINAKQSLWKRVTAITQYRASKVDLKCFLKVTSNVKDDSAKNDFPFRRNFTVLSQQMRLFMV